MKIFKRVIIYLLFLPVLFCGGPAEEQAGECMGIPAFTVRNSSEYTLNRLYMHDTPDYTGSTVIATDMAAGTELSVDISTASQKYFTFIRNVTTTSAEEIAVTTAYPLSFEPCVSYTLHILEEDFFLDEGVSR